jgi:hypothetical protein
MKIMKKVNLTILRTAFLLLVSVPTLEAQQTPKSGDVVAPSLVTTSTVREGERGMSQGSKNALTVDLYNTNVKDVEKLWKEYAKRFKGDTKRDKKNDEYFTDNAMIPELGGANTLDMFAKFSESSGNVNMALWFDLGGAYVNSKDMREKYVEAEKIVLAFATHILKTQTEAQLEEQSDELKKFEKQQTRLEDKNKSLLKDIEDYKKRITQAEADIQTNLKAQEESKAKIVSQKKLVEEIQKKLGGIK